MQSDHSPHYKSLGRKTVDFRTFVDLLDSDDEVLWVNTEVDSEYELGALLQQAEARGKAIWFERVKGSPFPVVGGVMSSSARHALSIGKSPAQMAGLDSWPAEIAAARANPLAPLVVDSAPVIEVVLTGADIDMRRLPIPRFFAGDTHRFITAGVGIVLDPETGLQNVGFYRAPLIDATHISVSAGGSSQLNKIYKQAEQQGQSLPVAYAIGVPPALLITAGCRIDRDESDMDIAGALQGQPLELIKCQTNDLLVPARAEVVIEAIVDFQAYVDHTMGEFPDQYGSTRSPVARVTAITHRKNAVFHTIMAGMNPEHNALGIYIYSALRAALAQHLAAQFTCIQDINVDLTPRRSGNRAQVAIAINKEQPDEPAKLIEAAFAFTYDCFPMEQSLQRVVIVDTDIDIRNPDDIEWAIAMRMNTQDKTKVYSAPARGGGSTARLGIDATLASGTNGERPVIPGVEKYRLDKYR
jgi:2,5-furandicarboxylate decarboxylase 1